MHKPHGMEKFSLVTKRRFGVVITVMSIAKPSSWSAPVTRRRFLRASGLIAATAAYGPFILRGQNLNDKLDIAAIGAGGKGESDTDGLASENIVALCDIDGNTLAKRSQKYPKAKLFRDYRKMLEEMKDIDAVTVSTPDHHHAPAAMMAIKLRKHVYCQKPLTHSIHEARMLTRAARKYKVATMMGNQGHSGEGVRNFCELLWSGIIGKVREAHCWTDRPIWPQGILRPTETHPVPPHVDWDLFLGPAAQRPFHKDAYHPFKWRGWWDFGTGALGDMGCHIIDPANWALKLSEANTIVLEAESSGVNNETAPLWSVVTYHFPARADMPPLKLVWWDGKKHPPSELFELKEGEKVPDNGSLFIGDQGKMLVGSYGESPKLLPAAKFKDFTTPPKTLPRVAGHYQEFITACKGGTPAGANFDYAGPFTEIVLLGNLAVRAGHKFTWDVKRMKAVDLSAANQYVRRKYRKGWVL